MKRAMSFMLSAILCLNFLLAVPVFAESEHLGGTGSPERFWNSKEPDPMVMALDGIVVRPVSFVATVVGSVFYVITLPFSAAGGNSDHAYEQMVKSPARATFSRPLGRFYLDFPEESVEIHHDSIGETVGETVKGAGNVTSVEKDMAE